MGLSASQGRLLALTSRLSDLEYRSQNIQNQKTRIADLSEAVSKSYLNALNTKKVTAYNATTNTQVDATLNRLYQLNKSDSNGTKRIIINAQGKVVIPSSMLQSVSQTNSSKVHTDNSSRGNYVKLTSTDQNAFIFSGMMNSLTNQAASQYTDKIKYDSTGGYYYITDYEVISNNAFLTDTQYLYRQLSQGNWFIVEYNEEGGTDGTGDWETISWSSADAQLMTDSDEENIAKSEAEYEMMMRQLQAKDKKFDLELKTIDSEHTAVQTEIDSVKKVMDKNIESSFKIFS